MELIKNNPYRIAGILSSATTKKLEKQKGRIKAYTKVGNKIKSDFDFQILENIDRTEDSVNKAFSNVEQNHHRIIGWEGKLVLSALPDIPRPLTP